ncbi:MAG TPA: hypothetical protein VF054_02600 [Micromonosporaceae bacterium]
MRSGTRELPVDGWDGVIWRKPNLVSALEVTVRTDLQGTGLSGKMLFGMSRVRGQAWP